MMKMQMQDFLAKTPTHAVTFIASYTDLLNEMYSRVPSPDPTDDRRALLLAHILKAQAIANASMKLAEIGGVEEIATIGRTLSEVIVNAFYLQLAEDIEVQRYIHFDSSNLIRQAKQLIAHSPAVSSVHSEDKHREMDEIALTAKELIQTTDKDRSWSRIPLIKRAEFVDERSDIKFFKSLVLTSTLKGHSATHGTIVSLSWFIAQVRGDDSLLVSDRENNFTGVLQGIGFALFILCMGLDDLFDFDLKPRIMKIMTQTP